MLRNCIARIVVVSHFVVAGYATAEDAQPDAPQVRWHYDLRAAHEVAVHDGKPLLLVFGAEWCGYCKKLENTTLAHPQLAAYINETFVTVHLDLDEEQGERVAEILDVSSLPCTVIVTPEAELLDKFLGYQGVAEYYEHLRTAAEKHAALAQTDGVAAPE